MCAARFLISTYYPHPAADFLEEVFVVFGVCEGIEMIFGDSGGFLGRVSSARRWGNVSLKIVEELQWIYGEMDRI